MQSHPNYPAAARRLVLIIGLFCSLNLKVRALRQVLARAGVTGAVRKSDFPPPPSGIFRVYSGRSRIEIPLENVYPAVMPGCSLCPDLTAEMADISVGAAEGFPDLNLVIVRSEAGMKLIKEARDKGLIELKTADPASLAHLEEAARNKRQRAGIAQRER